MNTDNFELVATTRNYHLYVDKSKHLNNGMMVGCRVNVIKNIKEFCLVSMYETLENHKLVKKYTVEKVFSSLGNAAFFYNFHKSRQFFIYKRINNYIK